MDFKQAKIELKKVCSNTKYFNKSFFNDYITALEKRIYNIENGIDDSFFDDGILLFNCFEKVYNSRFYRDNSCAYCEFLSIAHGKKMIRS